MVTRKEFEINALKVYQCVYLKYGIKRRYSDELAIGVTELLLMELPKIFNLDEKKYASALPDIMAEIPRLISNTKNIYLLASLLSITVFRHTHSLPRFFYFKIGYWFCLNRRLQVIDPAYFENLDSL
jgi:hypothetical protein